MIDSLGEFKAFDADNLLFFDSEKRGRKEPAKTIAFRRAKLSNAIDHSHFLPVILHPYLSKLDLENCQSFDLRAVTLIQKNAPRLSRLSIIRCNSLRAIGKIKPGIFSDKLGKLEFPYLKILEVYNCINFTHLKIKALVLDVIFLRTCSKIKEIKIESLLIRDLGLPDEFYKRRFEIIKLLNLNDFFKKFGWESYYSQLGMEPPCSKEEAIARCLYLDKEHDYFFNLRFFSEVTKNNFWKAQKKSFDELMCNDFSSATIENRIMDKETAVLQHAIYRNAMKQATRLDFHAIVMRQYEQAKSRELFKFLEAEIFDEDPGEQLEVLGKTIALPPPSGCMGLFRSFVTTVEEFKAIQSTDSPSEMHHSQFAATIRDLLSEIMRNYDNVAENEVTQFFEDLCLNLYLHELHIAGRDDLTALPLAGSYAMTKFSEQIFQLAMEHGTISLKEKFKAFAFELNNNIPNINELVSHLITDLVAISGELSWCGEENKLLFLLSHPQRAYHSLASMIDTETISYNTLNEGNPIQPLALINIKTLEKESCVAHICSGSPTEAAKISPLLTGSLRAMARKKMRLLEVNLQKPSGAEGKRSKALVDAYLSNGGSVLAVHADTVDGPVFEQGASLLNSDDFKVDSFANHFQAHVLSEIDHYTIDGNGYYLTGDDVEGKVSKAIRATKDVFTDMEAHSSFFHQLDASRKSRLFQYMFQLIKNMGEIFIHANRADSEALVDLVYIEHCKQDIDRGAVKNFMSCYLFQLLSGEKIDLNKALALIASILGRPQNAQERAILLHRLEPALDLLRTSTADSLKKNFKHYLANLGFIEFAVELTLFA